MTNRRNDPGYPLEKAVLIHVCQDGTLSYRTKDEPVFNRRPRNHPLGESMGALPVFSVDNKDEARSLIILAGKAQYVEHPLMPKEVWYRITIDYKPHLDLNDLPKVAAKLAELYDRMKKFN